MKLAMQLQNNRIHFITVKIIQKIPKTEYNLQTKQGI